MSATTRKLTVFALSLVVLRAVRQELGRGRAPARRSSAPLEAPLEPAREPAVRQVGAGALDEARGRDPQRLAAGAATSEAGDRSGRGFLLVLLGVGLALLVAFAGDLVVRGPERVPTRAPWTIVGADAGRGRAAIVRHGCGACHVIPGIRTARGRVGPQLVDFANQMYVAGVLANVPENLVRWLQDPRGVDPLTAMPDLGVTEQEARDMAAYLYEHP